MSTSLDKTFLHQVEVVKTCLVRSGGYERAARNVYNAFQGAVGESEEVYAECGTLGCINPRHLRLRAREKGKNLGEVNRAKTHCVNGHEFDTNNTYIRKDGARQCRACVRARMRRGKVRKGLQISIA